MVDQHLSSESSSRQGKLLQISTASLSHTGGHGSISLSECSFPSILVLYSPPWNSYASNCFVCTISATLRDKSICYFKLKIAFAYPPCHPTATICQCPQIITPIARHNLEIITALSINVCMASTARCLPSLCPKV
eukprot:scpid89677/ scgid9447/ 